MNQQQKEKGKNDDTTPEPLDVEELSVEAILRDLNEILTGLNGLQIGRFAVRRPKQDFREIGSRTERYNYDYSIEVARSVTGDLKLAIAAVISRRR